MSLRTHAIACARSHVIAMACAALAFLLPGEANAQEKRWRFMFHAGPELSGFKAGAEKSMRNRGYGETSPAVMDCFIFPAPCPGPIKYPRSWERGTETYMFGASYRVRSFMLNLLLTDGAGGETEGYSSTAGREYVRFGEGWIVGTTALANRNPFRIGAGPALMRVASGDSTRSQTTVRPGVLGEAGMDLIRWRALVTELRVQYRAFRAVPVTSQRGERYDVPYRSFFVGVGLGLEP